MVLLLPRASKTARQCEAGTLQAFWVCTVVSGTNMLEADTLSPVVWDLEVPWIRLVLTQPSSQLVVCASEHCLQVLAPADKDNLQALLF